MERKPSVYVEEITFSDGQTFIFNQKDKVIYVGPNNSGKSQTLREIVELNASDAITKGTVIHEIKLVKQGTQDDLVNFLLTHGTLSNDHYNYGALTIHTSWLYPWGNGSKLTYIHPMFMKNISANDRLSICNQQSSIRRDEPKTKPQHILYESAALMSHISSLFKRAFNKDIMFNFRGGSVMPIHVGKLPPPEIIDRASDEYVDYVEKNPLLDKQGDGVKSFTGILFESIVQKFDVTMIDEPEAFLHPPQMRLLGETLSSEVEGQLFVATHSSDILRGFLEGTKGNIRILRIQREGDVNVVHEIDKKAVEVLWAKPVLRYSNALDSLFHEQVIICENDSDCRLYNYAADYLINEVDKSFPDTCFVPTGGKHAIPGIVEAIRASGVPVKAIFDFDLISERNTINKTLDAFGCPKDEKELILDLWGQINSSVVQGFKEPDPDEFKNYLTKLIDSIPAESLSKSKVEEAFKQKKPWSKVKRDGIMGLPKGNVRKVFTNFNDRLKKMGIFLVPVGEVENFCPEIGLHGPSFVEKFLAEQTLDSTDLSPLLDFVEDVYSNQAKSSL
ncbi:AAA family ATPase [Pantoea sp. EA-12]|uniref:ATP-dependent nuclease n=1 Tax=Pantoea sp. EA-12 TaxID=3043303 RepID=UPI0024B5DBCA|nr:AAA family ATPase [Pantoea sp. EA-12]MDI9222513.1 AAA family ATPase [Pantoea sp. EA-12]